jgi:hypothetical protein
LWFFDLLLHAGALSRSRFFVASVQRAAWLAAACRAATASCELLHIQKPINKATLAAKAASERKTPVTDRPSSISISAAF